MRAVGGLVLVVGGIAASAQSRHIPATAEPMHRVVFENEVVRLLEVVVAVGATTAYHQHDMENVAVVIDGQKVSNQGLDATPVILDVARGHVVYTPAPTSYVHRVGNLGPAPVRLLNAELKGRRQGRPPTTGASVSPDVAKWENSWVQLQRTALEPGAAEKAQAWRGLRVFTSAGVTERGTVGTAGQRAVAIGDWQWHSAEELHSIRNAGTTRLDWLDLVVR